MSDQVLAITKKSDFLIPDYQRPYAWTDEQYRTLRDDLFTFAIPDNNYKNFDDDEPPRSRAPRYLQR
jgi:uncharacterized protein with ParB-like and HNH nuclease domain